MNDRFAIRNAIQAVAAGTLDLHRQHYAAIRKDAGATNLLLGKIRVKRGEGIIGYDRDYEYMGQPFLCAEYVSEQLKLTKDTIPREMDVELWGYDLRPHGSSNNEHAVMLTSRGGWYHGDFIQEGDSQEETGTYNKARQVLEVLAPGQRKVWVSFVPVPVAAPAPTPDVDASTPKANMPNLYWQHEDAPFATRTITEHRGSGFHGVPNDIYGICSDALRVLFGIDRKKRMDGMGLPVGDVKVEFFDRRQKDRTAMVRLKRDGASKTWNGGFGRNINIKCDGHRDVKKLNGTPFLMSAAGDLVQLVCGDRKKVWVRFTKCGS